MARVKLNSYIVYGYWQFNKNKASFYVLAKNGKAAMLQAKREFKGDFVSTHFKKRK